MKLLGLRTDSDEILNLDFLRLVASVAIVWHHSHHFWYPPDTRAADSARSDGLALFVDLFFMISGFVMAFVYRGRLGSVAAFADFYWRRIARLYPLHLVVLGFTIAVWAVLLTRGASDTAPSFAPSCIVQTALLMQEYFDCGSPYTFNGVTWSVSVEMGLYVLLPLLLMIVSASPALFALLAVAGAGSAFALYAPGGDVLALPNLMRGWLGFCIGILAAQLRKRLPGRAAIPVLVPLLTAMLLAEMLLGAPHLASFLTAALLFVVAVICDRERRIAPGVRQLSPLGQLTYSMYIWHSLPILIFMNVVADKMFPGNVPVLVAMTALTWGLVLALSYWSYFWIELPMRRWLIRLHPAAKARIARRMQD